MQLSKIHDNNNDDDDNDDDDDDDDDNDDDNVPFNGRFRQSMEFASESPDCALIGNCVSQLNNNLRRLIRQLYTTTYKTSVKINTDEV
jgi:hypothetical protein